MSTYTKIVNASRPLETGIMKVTCALAPLQHFCRVACVPGAVFYHIFHSLLYTCPLLCNSGSVKMS